MVRSDVIDWGFVFIVIMGCVIIFVNKEFFVDLFVLMVRFGMFRMFMFREYVFRVVW